MTLVYNSEISTEGRSLVCFGGETSAEAIAAKAWENAKFYAEVRGYTVACSTEANCGNCLGDGMIPKKRGFGLRTCPDCKGRGK